MEDSASFARLIEAIRPWLGHLVIVGGWAHRLHRFHPLAGKPTYLPLRTRDVDVALSLHAPLEGNIREALEHAAGINAQKLPHLDLLLLSLWSVRVGPEVDVPLDRPTDVVLPNPLSFIVQKLLIHDKRPPNKKAQDVLYIHDTLELFGGALDNLRTLWIDQLRPGMPAKSAKRVETLALTLFEQVTDTMRDAARIPQDRRLSPDIVRDTCDYGLREILGDVE